MSANIVQLISSQVGGNVNRLSSMLGETPEKTQSVVGAAVPTLLAGLTHVASTPEGAHRLDNAINQQDPNVASNFSSQLANQANFNPETHSTMLTNLFGAGTSTNIVSILGRFTGVKGSSITSVLGSIAPFALGLIGRESNAQGGGASGITNYLNSQKQNISAAMPSGLSNILGSIPGFGGFMQKTPAEPELAHAGASPSLTGTSAGEARAFPEARPEEPRFRQQSSPTRWLIPLLLLAIILWAFYAWNRSRMNTREPEPVNTRQQPANAPSRGAPPQ
jgi:hypothetical protein